MLHQHGVDHVGHELREGLSSIGGLIRSDVEVRLPIVKGVPVIGVRHLGNRVDNGLHVRFGVGVQQMAANAPGVEFRNHVTPIAIQIPVWIVL